MQVNFRVDDNTKTKFDILCNELGISSSSAIVAYMKKAVREQRLPMEFNLLNKNDDFLELGKNLIEKNKKAYEELANK